MPCTSATPPIAIPPEIRAAIARGAWIVFNLSGGKDSSASMFAVAAVLDAMDHPRARRLAIHADLGRAEWDTTPRMVERLADQAELPLQIVRRKAGDLFDRWAQRFENGKRRYESLETYNLIGPWSSASLRFCTSEAKAHVIGPHLARTLAGETIINVLGIRRDESPARAQTPEFKPDQRYAKPGNAHGTEMMLWHPIVHWTTPEVFRAHETYGIPLHEAYTRYGSSRLSCRYCVLQSLPDARASASAPSNRDAMIHLVAMEADSTFSFQPARWLADTAPHLVPPALTERIRVAKADALLRRRLEAELPTGLRYIKGWPPRIPTRPEAALIAASRSQILARHGLADLYPSSSAVRDRFADLMGDRKAA